MILAVSTSAPEIQVAVWEAGNWTFSGYRASERNASGAVMALVEEAGIGLSDVEGFLVDVGPGSFSGVKAGVTMVKTWGHFLRKPTYSVDAFDLIDKDTAVAIASKRGEVYFRRPGSDPEIKKIAVLPDGIVGPYEGSDDLRTGDFARSKFPEDVREVPALELVPLYVAPPSISQPKQAHIMGETVRGK